MDVTENVINDILAHCKNLGHIVMPQLATFVAKTLMMNSTLGYTENGYMSANTIQDLVKTAVERLVKQDSPQIETMKLQIAYINTKHQLTLNKEKEERERMLVGDQRVRTIVELADDSKVFGEIGLYILHQAKQVKDNDEKSGTTAKDIYVALENVIPKQYMHKFIVKSSEDKRLQLKDLWKIVWGMVTYTRELAQSGTGIDNLTLSMPTLIQNAMDAIQKDLSEAEQVYSKYFLVLNSGKLDEKRFQRLRSESVNKFQYAQLLRSIYNEAEKLNKKVDDIIKFVKNHVVEIQKTEQQSDTSRSDVYSMFIILAEAWMELELVQEVLDEIETRHEFLKNYKAAFKPTLSEDGSFAQSSSSLSNRDSDSRLSMNDVLDLRPDSVMISEADLSSEEIPWITPPPRDVLPEYAGVDVFYFVTNKNLLKLGDSSLGYVCHNDKYYSFSSEKNAKGFRKNPEYYISYMKNVVIKSPDYVILLEQEDVLPKSIEMETGSGKRKVTTAECDIQTDTHPIESHIDHKYEFSQWKLRKRALQVADLRNKKTHSTQTEKSHFRRESETQVYQPKTKGTQTAKDAGTNPIKHVRYVQGLRGDSNQKMSIVNIQLEIDGPK